MTINTVLTDEQKELWQREREAIQQLIDLVELSAFPVDEQAHLVQALDQLNELFLLVVVGEFNSGKSALINALLGDRFLKEGVTPTTDRIHIVKYGELSSPEMIGEDIRILRYPAELLRQIHIVDTPGTNAVLRHHEAIVRDFIPRSDMVIFVTSADRPFTESERQFLEAIRDWGKKVVVVINKIDILEDESSREEVKQFVHGQILRLLSLETALFPVSARHAQVGASEEEHSYSNNFLAFQSYLQETLTEQGMITLKLMNPLGVALKIGHQFHSMVRSRLEILKGDSEILDKVERQLTLFESDTASEFERHQDRMERDLLEMRLRGEEFIDDNLRLLKIPQMLRGKQMQALFEQKVVADTPAKMESNIQEIIDWLVERELRQWRLMADELGRRQETDTLQEAAREAAGGFAYNRRQLLDTIGHHADEVIQSYNRAAEAERLSTSLKESIALVGLVEVGAISLGLILKAVLTTAAADATGILAAGILGVLGLTIIPLRRGQAKQELRKKMNDLQAKLKVVLGEHFTRELERAVSRLNEALAPYRRFVRSEETQLKITDEDLESILATLESLRLEIDPQSNP
jgi:small GTP-binding protein